MAIFSFTMKKMTSHEIHQWLWNKSPDFHGLKDVVKKWDSVDVDLQPVFAGTPLMWAIGNDHPALVRSLVELGAEINMKSIYGHFSGKTPLEQACEEGFAHVVKTLLEAGADTGVDKGFESYDAWYHTMNGAFLRGIDGITLMKRFEALPVLIRHELGWTPDDYPQLLQTLDGLGGHRLKMRAHVFKWMAQARLQKNIPALVSNKSFPSL